MIILLLILLSVTMLQVVQPAATPNNYNPREIVEKVNQYAAELLEQLREISLKCKELEHSAEIPKTNLNTLFAQNAEAIAKRTINAQQNINQYEKRHGCMLPSNHDFYKPIEERYESPWANFSPQNLDVFVTRTTQGLQELKSAEADPRIYKEALKMVLAGCSKLQREARQAFPEITDEKIAAACMLKPKK